MFNRSGGRYPTPPHAGGPYTNGPMVTEYVSSKLAIPLYNYAVSAATTGVANLVDTLWKSDFCPGTKRRAKRL